MYNLSDPTNVGFPLYLLALLQPRITSTRFYTLKYQYPLSTLSISTFTIYSDLTGGRHTDWTRISYVHGYVQKYTRLDSTRVETKSRYIILVIGMTRKLGGRSEKGSMLNQSCIPQEIP